MCAWFIQTHTHVYIYVNFKYILPKTYLWLLISGTLFVTSYWRHQNVQKKDSGGIKAIILFLLLNFNTINQIRILSS